MRNSRSLASLSSEGESWTRYSAGCSRLARKSDAHTLAASMHSSIRRWASLRTSGTICAILPLSSKIIRVSVVATGIDGTGEVAAAAPRSFALGGSRAPKPFQEFWVFEFDEGAWRLRRIAQTQDGDYLDYENTVDGVEHAQPAGAAPPRSAHSPKTPAKPSKVRYLLDSLERRDPLWNQTQMMERARQIFAAVYAARATSDLSAPVANALFPNVAEKLRADIERDRQIGREVAYEHFRVHDVEIVLARNYQDNRQDEFFTRISAEAQVTSRLKGSIVTQDQHVKAFEQYWAFGRLENQWKLKQMLPAAHGKTLISRPNIDEDVAR